MSEFTRRGAEVWAISPDQAEKLEDLRRKEKLEIPMLLDPELEITASFGLLNERGNLPHPAAVIVEADGTISYLRVDEDYSQRPSNAELLDALGPPSGEK